MKLSGKNVSLTSYDDLFGAADSQLSTEKERVVDIPLDQLHPFKDHPFQVVDDARMTETAESIKAYGVLMPIVARPLESGGYEIVSGHRRKRACEMAGLDTIPVIVRNIDDDTAIIMMVDSNLQRENILPSERAKAYKMKLEAVKRRAGRPSKEEQENRGQLGHNLDPPKKARDIVAEDAGESPRNVQRFIRLNSLEPELMTMVDEGRLAFNPAVEVSYLKPHEQHALVNALESTQATPSLSQAQRMKKLSQEGKATELALTSIMREEKKPLTESVTLSHDTLRRFFPKTYTAKQMENVIIKLLEAWQRNKQRQQTQQL